MNLDDTIAELTALAEAHRAEQRAAITEVADAVAQHAGALLDVLDELAADVHHVGLTRASDDARSQFLAIAERLRAIAERV